MKYTHPITLRKAEIIWEKVAVIRNPNWEDVRVESECPMSEQLEREWYIADESPVWEKSDGYHTFNELYDHRTALFAALCLFVKARKSRLHNDGTMFDGMFIVMMYIDWQQISYHIDNKYRDIFDIEETDKSDVWDWHSSNDVVNRLLAFVKNARSWETG